MRHLWILSLTTLIAAGCASTQEPPAAEPVPAPEPPPAPEPEPVVAPAPPEPPPAPPEPVALSTEDLVKAYERCRDMWVQQNEAETKACSAAAGTVETVDWGQGPQPVAELDRAKQIWSAFSEAGVTEVALLATKNRVAELAVYKGFHKADAMGAEAKGNLVGIVFARVVEMTDDGKESEVRTYLDQNAFLGQTGGSKTKHRKAQGAPDGASARAITAGDDKETRNIELARAAVRAWNVGDFKGFTQYFHKDWKLFDQTQPKDLKGKRAHNFLKNMKKAFPDGALEESETAWAAGDYVVIEQTMKGTNKAKLREFGIKKATNKPVEVRMLQVMKVTDGKISEIWQLGNGLAIPKQLGLAE